MLPIKLKGTAHVAQRNQIFCPHPHPRPLGWGQKVSVFFFSESSHGAYQIKGKEV